ncbi:acyl carrier protein [Pleurocapsa sp. FMAR1]|uniref:acyl carrier protein n=1 Tax=Pleurocapsa sp. FMAR1 TaxID=3040204 RepID=UPI0029C986E0|nr:acyl carrier protein [Pleurocapsa sp. FMAR1]
MINPALKDVLIDLGFEEAELTDTASIRQDLQLDSTETVDISLGLKRRLGINIKLESRQDITLAQISEKIAQAVDQSSSSDSNYVENTVSAKS